MTQFRRRPPLPWAFGTLSGLLLIAMLASMASGAVTIPWQRVPEILLSGASADIEVLRDVLVEIRVPRVLFASAVGAALAVAGVAMQSLFRNPLAEPALLGLTSGAALGAVLAIVFLAGSALSVAVSAFVGSLAAISVAYAVGRRFRGMAGLLLAGVGINTVAGSGLGLMTYLANDAQLRDMAFWSMGSLAGLGWRSVSWVLPWSLLWMLYLCGQWRVLNALLLGEREAGFLGYRPTIVRRKLIVVIALLVGPLVALTGGIGFVGLIVPHVVRMVMGAHHRALLPLSMLVGALLLTLADWQARLVIAPAELPIGLLTSLIGGPFFFWLLIRSRPSSLDT